MRILPNGRKVSERRIHVAIGAVLLAFAVLAGAYWQMQSAQADRFAALARTNSLRAVRIPAPRGLIHDRNGKLLVENGAVYLLLLDRSQLQQAQQSDPGALQKTLAFVSDITGTTVEDLQKRIAAQNHVPRVVSVAIAEELTVAQVAAVHASSTEVPALRVVAEPRRHYPFGAFAAHVLGYVGEVTPEDLARNASLERGQLIGKKGVELMYDHLLRGRDGIRYVRVDAHGREIAEEPSGRRDAVPGQDIYLNLDFQLQRQAEEYFVTNEFVGVAVALDPTDGGVLVMASSPAFDPNVFSRRFTPDAYKVILSNPFKIEVNRAVAGLYSPGSVFKIVMAVAGLESGVITPATTFHDRGSEVFFGRRFRGWRREGLGIVDVEDALKVSSDIFFYHVGARLGIDGIAEWSQQFGLGSITGIDLENEKAGLVPSEEWAKRVQNRKWYQSETISVAIGQGPLLATPLQMANVMAAIATGGTVYQPRILQEVRSRKADGTVDRRRLPPRVIHRVPINPVALAAVREGLLKVVNEPGGTGANARLPNVIVAGKTGTAQVVAQQGWVRSETLPFKYRDNAWFGSYAPAAKPTIASAIIIQHGGHGGAEAAPLAKVLYETHFGQPGTGIGDRSGAAVAPRTAAQ